MLYWIHDKTYQAQLFEKLIRAEIFEKFRYTKKEVRENNSLLTFYKLTYKMFVIFA